MASRFRGTVEAEGGWHGRLRARPLARSSCGAGLASAARERAAGEGPGEALSPREGAAGTGCGRGAPGTPCPRGKERLARAKGSVGALAGGQREPGGRCREQQVSNRVVPFVGVARGRVRKPVPSLRPSHKQIVLSWALDNVKMELNLWVLKGINKRKILCSAVSCHYVPTSLGGQRRGRGREKQPGNH